MMLFSYGKSKAEENGKLNGSYDLAFTVQSLGSCVKGDPSFGMRSVPESDNPKWPPQTHSLQLGCQNIELKTLAIVVILAKP